MSEEEQVKVVLVGDSGVGKTSILGRFVSLPLDSSQDATIGAAFLSRTLLAGEKKYRFNVWDTAGQERFRSLTNNYFREAQVVVMVGDVTRPYTFQSLKTWYKDIKENAPSNVVLAVAGNKNDLPAAPSLSERDTFSWATAIRAIYVATSAKTGNGIDSLFLLIAEKLTAHEATTTAASVREVFSRSKLIPAQRRESRSRCCES